MYHPLQVRIPNKKPHPLKKEKTYEFKINGTDGSLTLRITTPTDLAETLIDVDTLSRIKKEVNSFYILRNRAGNPYIQVSRTSNDGKYEKTSLSRFILNIGKGNKLVVDHINGNTLDNRRENLQEIPHGQNIRNSKQTKTKSGMRGCYYNKKTNKYVSMVCLGSFDSAYDAHQAYKEAYEKLFPGIIHEDQW